MSRRAGKGLGVALLGGGQITQLVHVPTLARIGCARAVVIAEQDQERRERVLARVPGAVGFAGWREAIEHPGVEAVVIALPNELHASAAVAALAAGRHVYIEKPLASDPVGGRRVLAAHAGGDLAAMVGFNLRFHPLHRHARKLVGAGAIGPVRSAHFAFGIPEAELPEWKGRPGGSVLQDLGSHVVDLARYLLGQEIAMVAAGGDSERAWLALELDGGTQVTASLDRGASAHDAFELRGRLGSLHVDRLRGVEVREEGRRARLAPVARVRRWRSPSYEPSYELALRAFVGAVRGRPDSTAAGLIDGQRAIEAIAGAEASRANGSGAEAPVHG